MCRPRRRAVAQSSRRKRLKRGAALRRLAARAGAGDSAAPGQGEKPAQLECLLEVRNKAGEVVESVRVPTRVLLAGDAERDRWIRMKMREFEERMGGGRE